MESEREDADVNEVSIDNACTSAAALSDTSWLDSIISTTISSWQKTADTSIHFFALRTLVNDNEFNQRKQAVSVVECFNYVFSNLEKIEQDTENISLEKTAAIESCSRDLAAAYLRVADNEDTTSKALINGVLHDDLSCALQRQCDVSYLEAFRGNFERFNSSILKEIHLLLKLDNIEDAYLKIVRYNLYTEGLNLFSSHVSNVELGVFDKIFEFKKKIFEKYIDYMDEAGGGNAYEINRDRASASIIVDKKGERGYKDRKFHVQDLSSALKLAQNGGTIFLEDGDYTTETYFDVKQKSLCTDKTITIIGASTNECSIHGTIKISAAQKVTFKRIKFEIGDSSDSKDAIFLLGGSITFSSCLLEATVNTLWYLIGQETSTTKLTINHCVVDGLESCQRAVTFQGKNIIMELEESLFKDMFSVVTVLDTADTENISVIMRGCNIEDVQTCVDMSIPSSSVTCHIHSCNMSFVLYDQDAQMDAVKVDRGESLSAHNNNVSFKHIDGKGFFLKNIAEVILVRNCIQTPSNIDRKLAVGEAVATENVEKVTIEKLHILGFRIGVRLNLSLEAHIRQTLIESCSVGVLVMKNGKHKKLSVVETIMRTVYYGVMGEDSNTAVSLQRSQFIDVPKALLLCKEMIRTLKEEECNYLLSREYTTSNKADMLETEMNLYLATSENLPHRVAYEREDVHLVFKFADLGFSN